MCGECVMLFVWYEFVDELVWFDWLFWVELCVDWY